MPKERPPSYTPAPRPPTDPELRRRYDAIMAVIAQTQTVSGAAESLGISRNHFQTILHRSLAALIDAMTPKPAGRPAKPAQEVALEAENARLKSELAALKERSETIDRMLDVVTSISSGKGPSLRSRSRSKRPKPRTEQKQSSEDPEPALTLHKKVTAMRDASIPIPVCASVLGVSASTVRRRLQLPKPRARTERSVAPDACQRVREIVRATHGQVGAQSLGKSCGLPRRKAAAIKKRELREMELERKARCRSVSVRTPGIVRGFDAMHLACADGKAYWLVAADAAVPFRTSIMTVPVYDADHVIAALRRDFEAHGPPLVLRLDRIACQRTPEVDQLLRHYEVLALHGPPRHPYYYGQLERQNREHRAWLRALEHATRDELAATTSAMRIALNALWARPTLGWCTAEQAWERRQRVSIDRRELRTEVEQRASGLISSGLEALHARRIAIETALTDRGLLAINQGAGR